MEAHANKAWDGWRDVWHLMKLALQRQRRCMNFIFQQGWRWCVLRPMTTSVSLGHYWIQCCGSHEVRRIKIHSVCRINVLFSCFKFSSWCLVCISNVQLMMLGMHFKIHGLSYVTAIHMFNRHVFLFHMMCFVCMRWVDNHTIKVWWWINSLWGHSA